MSYSDSVKKSFEYEWCQCSCCPYGYHIDLDFVRYCESICQSERTSSISRRKDRRRQRQSMDVLLGLAPSTPTPVPEKPPSAPGFVQSPTVSSTLSDVVFDFEKTLQRTANKNVLSSNLPDVTAVTGIHRSPSVSSLSTSTTSASSLTILPYEQKDFDAISLESNGLSPAALQNIREQMALSLKRMKQLEEQVKTIPVLKSEIERLRNEKKELINLEQNNLNINGNYRQEENTTPKRDFGVNCVVLTRSVGVGRQIPNTRSVSTATIQDVGMAFTKYTQTTQKESVNAKIGPDAVTTAQVAVQAESTRFLVNKECIATPDVASKASQAVVETKVVGTSNDEFHQNDFNKDSHYISLADLSFHESKVENKISKSTVGVQCQRNGSNKSTQHEVKVQSKGCQNSVRLLHKYTQPEIFLGTSKNTDTTDLIRSAEIGVNTAEQAKECFNCKKENVEVVKDEQPSRIPRLNERRKFERQITYTKIPATTSTSSRLSGLDLSQKAREEQLDEKFLTSDDTPQDDDLPKMEKSPYEQTQRKKACPSKEMQAAMKVLNDSLQKGHTKNIENQVKSAVHIILQEWFKISSLVTAEPRDVEDYLDSFEEVSSSLLEYIVNMVDASGNTAMHYAVSHGNFDVVSILLDSKVCDINKQNKAGYTSVMLVSLAEVRSQTHSNVVKRLFSLADVNVRAKQHGQTALMLAVSHGRLDMVTMLIDAGADINIQDEDGSTALMCAAEHGHVEIVKYFLSQSECDSSISDVDGSTALKIAMEAGHRHIGVLLYAHQRNLSGPPKSRKCKSASASPRAPSSPIVTRKYVRTSNK
nr:KN motif and ankyrin repeat domain-containing protein 1-like [Onthophagus taurus]